MIDVARYISVLLVCAFFLSACTTETPNQEFIARVGDRYLTVDDINPLFDASAVSQDSSEALEQIAEEWVKNELIAQEAIRRGLRNDDEVRKLLEETERSVLISTFLSRLFQEEPLEPTEEEIEAYYVQNADQLALREDYIRVRYLNIAQKANADRARLMLRDASAVGKADSLWPSLVDRYSIDKDASLSLASRFYPRSILFPSATLRDMVTQLDLNQISPVIEEVGSFHFVQVAERRSAGVIPQLAWIEDELKRRLTIEARKQMLARQVQRLRTEALAREDLEIKYLSE